MGGRGKGEVTKVRESILRKRGLRKGRYGKLDKEQDQTIKEPIPCRANRGNKTLLMVTLERLYNSDIDSLLDITKPLKEVAERLVLDESTVSKWRLRRGLRDTIKEPEHEYVLE